MSRLNAPDDHARYHRSFPGAWPHLREGIEATVERHPDGRWWAYCHVSLPNEAREQWNKRPLLPVPGRGRSLRRGVRP